jgi:hypothetical protein
VLSSSGAGLVPASAALGSSLRRYLLSVHTFFVARSTQGPAAINWYQPCAVLYTKLDSKDGDDIMNVDRPGGRTHGTHLLLCGYIGPSCLGLVQQSPHKLTRHSFHPSPSPGRVNTVT